MGNIHKLGTNTMTQAELEKVDPQFAVEGLLKAREKTLEVLARIRSELKEGASERDVLSQIRSIFADYGVTQHWHRPFVRFAEGTRLTYNDDESDIRLKHDWPYYLDVAPVWPGAKLGMDSKIRYESDYGDTFIFGQNAEAQKMIDSIHNAFDEAKQYWRQKKSGEEIYGCFKKRVENEGFIFREEIDGHRLGDFPHIKYTRDLEYLSKIEFIPTAGLWMLEVMITHPNLKMGAFYEDLMI